MPRGGARIGAGRKRKTPRAHWLTGDAGKRGLALVESPAVGARDASLVYEPPATLGPAERSYWAAWEPEARAAGTLHSATLPGFTLLCQVAVDTAQLRARIHEDGAVLTGAEGTKAHPLWVSYRGLAQRLDQLLKSYSLSAMGKPAAVTSPVNDEKLELRRLLAIS